MATGSDAPTNKQLEELQGSMLALRVVVDQLERKAANVIWDSPAKRRKIIVRCIIGVLKKCITAVGKCPKTQQAMTPCEQDEKLEFGVCVPKPDFEA